MPRRASLSLRNSPQLINQLQILREILIREPRSRAPPITLLKVFVRLVLARQHTASKRRVRNRRDAEFSACLQKGDVWVFDVHGEGGVFNLDGGDRVNGVSAAESRRRALAEADVGDFASFDGFGHGADDGFDRDFAVEAVAETYILAEAQEFSIHIS